MLRHVLPSSTTRSVTSLLFPLITRRVVTHQQQHSLQSTHAGHHHAQQQQSYFIRSLTTSSSGQQQQNPTKEISPQQQEQQQREQADRQYFSSIFDWDHLDMIESNTKSSSSTTSSSSSPTAIDLPTILSIPNPRMRIKTLIKNGHLNIVLELIMNEVSGAAAESAVRTLTQDDLHHAIALVIKYHLVSSQFNRSVEYLTTMVNACPTFIESESFAIICHDIGLVDRINGPLAVDAILDSILPFSKEQTLRLIDVYLALDEPNIINKLVAALKFESHETQEVYEEMLHLALKNKATDIIMPWTNLVIDTHKIIPSLPLLQRLVTYFRTNHLQRDHVTHIVQPFLDRKDYYNIAAIIAYNELVDTIPSTRTATAVIDLLSKSDADHVTTQIINMYLQLELLDQALVWYNRRLTKFGLAPTAKIIDNFASYHRYKKHRDYNLSCAKYWRNISFFMKFSQEHLAECYKHSHLKQMPPMQALEQIHAKADHTKEIKDVRNLKGLQPRDWMYNVIDQSHLDNIYENKDVEALGLFLSLGKGKGIPTHRLMEVCYELYFPRENIMAFARQFGFLGMKLRGLFINSPLFSYLMHKDFDAGVSLLSSERSKDYQNEITNSILVNTLVEKGHIRLAMHMLMNKELNINRYTCDKFVQACFANNMYSKQVYSNLVHMIPGTTTIDNLKLGRLIVSNKFDKAWDLFNKHLFRHSIGNEMTLANVIKMFKHLFGDPVHNEDHYKRWSALAIEGINNTMQLKNMVYCAWLELIDPSATGQNIDHIVRVVGKDSYFFSTQNRQLSPFLQEYLLLVQVERQVNMFLQSPLKTFSRATVDSVILTNSVVNNNNVKEKIDRLERVGNITETMDNPKVNIQKASSSSGQAPPIGISQESMEFLTQKYLQPVINHLKGFQPVEEVPTTFESQDFMSGTDVDIELLDKLLDKD
ncbi:hypothetical protein SAMD00019534_044440 [Acytostelium subglobosum LB1]|uniref:hypothetical protein n=1 Tax=Acytostelium subglobosum LB1 TaxID=1410327 RepID=UPI0006451DC2|nr:hypothetical protein SAMD00019534_044440 [Acytostelium subglobosum LB1]GAM21269.1 hypothetical protein SAMD00019534_044440 [Acytostelium subglobosum LB1]|eukprot:XP_012755388.1 hypothetical protein SAMD00019534_044440 [Acytostelium subglobosum LB1]